MNNVGVATIARAIFLRLSQYLEIRPTTAQRYIELINDVRTGIVKESIKGQKANVRYQS